MGEWFDLIVGFYYLVAFSKYYSDDNGIGSADGLVGVVAVGHMVVRDWFFSRF